MGDKYEVSFGFYAQDTRQGEKKQIDKWLFVKWEDKLVALVTCQSTVSVWMNVYVTC